jgi:D-alanyl-D-alanine carboxypeptidase
MLVIALAALGCGAKGPTERASTGLLHVLTTGHVGAGVSGPFDTGRATIRNLDPHLLAALQDATRDAQGDGVKLVVTSGWRSRAHQQRLFDEAVRKYGSVGEALRYVSTPNTSAHVTGDAVDIGPTEGDRWLRRHGAAYGLCQIYANEIWHYELATTPGGRCPDLLPDASGHGSEVLPRSDPPPAPRP